MQQLDIWPSKQAKIFIEAVEAQWGCRWKPEGALAGTAKGRVFYVTRDLANIDWRKLRISSVGLYISEFIEGKLRLSMEGSQLIGPFATKNIVEITRESAKQWLKGDDIEVEDASAEGSAGTAFKGHVIIKSGDDFFGSGPFKEGAILNHVSKGRRLPPQA